MLKYRPQFDDNPFPFDVRPVLDESRGIEFTYTRKEMGDMLQVVEDRLDLLTNIKEWSRFRNDK